MALRTERYANKPVRIATSNGDGTLSLGAKIKGKDLPADQKAKPAAIVRSILPTGTETAVTVKVKKATGKGSEDHTLDLIQKRPESERTVADSNGRQVSVPRNISHEDKAKQLVHTQILRLQNSHKEGGLTEVEERIFLSFRGKRQNGQLVFDSNAIEQAIKKQTLVFKRESELAVARADLKSAKDAHLTNVDKIISDYSKVDNELHNSNSEHHDSITAKIEERRVLFDEKIEAAKEEKDRLYAIYQEDTSNTQAKAAYEKSLKAHENLEAEHKEMTQNILDSILGIEADANKDAKKVHDELTKAVTDHEAKLETARSITVSQRNEAQRFYGVKDVDTNPSVVASKKKEEKTVTDDVKGFFGDVWNFMKTNNWVKFGGISAATLFVIKFIMDQLNGSSSSSPSPEQLAAVLSQMPNANSGLTTASLQGAK